MSMTIYDAPKYAELKQVDDIRNLSEQERYDYITKNAGWKSPKDSELEGICLGSNEGWNIALDENEELVNFHIWYYEEKQTYIAQSFIINDEDTKRLRDELLKKRIIEEYKSQSEVCLAEFLKSRVVKIDLATAFELYIKLLHEQEQDEFFRMNSEEGWIENCSKKASNVIMSDKLNNLLNLVTLKQIRQWKQK